MSRPERRGRRGAALAAVVTLGALVAGPAGAAMTERRSLEVGAFDQVHFAGAGTVELSQGPAPRLTARGPAALLDGLSVDTRDGTLHIRTPDHATDLVLELQVADLSAFVSEGDGRIVGDDLDVDALELTGLGAGSFMLLRLEARELAVRGHGATRFDLSGQVHTHVVELSGTGDYQAGELISDCVTLQVDGASDVRLWAELTLDVEVAGAASVRYAGSPRVEQRVTGMARVLRLPTIAI